MAAPPERPRGATTTGMDEGPDGEDAGPSVPRGRERRHIRVAAVLLACAAVLGAVVVSLALLGVGAGSGGGSDERLVDVTLGDVYVEPRTVTVPRGERVVLEVTNRGALNHDLKRDGEEGTPLLGPGDTARVEVGRVTEDVWFWCTIPGHKSAGMRLLVRPEGKSPPRS